LKDQSLEGKAGRTKFGKAGDTIECSRAHLSGGKIKIEVLPLNQISL
jgi:hypothetical protein